MTQGNDWKKISIYCDLNLAVKKKFKLCNFFCEVAIGCYQISRLFCIKFISIITVI